MKILGFILTLLGTNGITAALVARQSLLYDTAGITDLIHARIDEVLDSLSGPMAAMARPMVEGLVDGMMDNFVDFISPDGAFAQMIDRILIASIVILICGIIAFIVGFALAGKRKHSITCPHCHGMVSAG